jgi:hypothetical protein
MNRWTGIFLFAALSIGGDLLAQNCGNLSGTVLDPSGAAVVGAGVHLQASTPQDTTTGAHGSFILHCVGNDPYQITVNASGFAESQVSGRGYANITVHLRIADVHTEVEVGEDSGVSVDTDHGAGTHTLTAQDLQGMADDPDDFKRQLQVLAASSGGAPGQAIITVDGFQNSSSLPPKSSIASIRVNPDMFSSEYDRPPYQGGRVEIFTKPGRDSLHGALFFTDSESGLNATDPFAVSATPASKRRYGFEFGGPIRRQKSDFFLALERRDINEFNVVNAVVLNSEGEQTTLSQNVPAPQRLWIGSARTDWQLNPKNMLAATYSANINNSGNVGSGGLVLEEAGYGNTVSEQDLRLTDIFTLSPTLLHETHIGFTWKNTTDVPLSTAPSLQVAGAFTGGGATAGHLQDRERDLEVDDDILWTHHKHSVKIGVASLGIMVHDVDPDTFNGAFVFGGGLAPGSRRWHATDCDLGIATVPANSARLARRHSHHLQRHPGHSAGALYAVACGGLRAGSMGAQAKPIACIGIALCPADLAWQLWKPGSQGWHRVVARSQAAMGDSCTGRLVFKCGHAGRDHRGVPAEWRAPNPNAALLTIVHTTTRAHTFYNRRGNDSAIRTRPGANMVVPVSAWCRA